MALILFFALIGVSILGLTGALIIRAGRVRSTECDYILVLGTKVGSESLQERIACAGDYLIRHPNAVAIVTGGNSTDHPLSEGEYMFQALTAMGIDEHRLWVEDQALSTWTNLRYGLAMLEQRTGVCPSAVGIVTHDYHLFRTAMHASAQGAAVLGIPAHTNNKLRWFSGFLREIAGVWHYIILGGLYL